MKNICLCMCLSTMRLFLDSAALTTPRRLLGLYTCIPLIYICRTICPLTRTSISTCTTFMKRKSTVRPIVLSHVHSSDHLITTHAILSNFFTTFDLIVQKLHIYTRFNAFLSHNCSFRSCKFRTNVFLLSLIICQ